MLGQASDDGLLSDNHARPKYGSGIGLSPEVSWIKCSLGNDFFRVFMRDS